MKHVLLICIVVLASCQKEPALTEKQQKENEIIAKTYQNKYMEGNVNCE